jgi:hypothetical protein
MYVALNFMLQKYMIMLNVLKYSQAYIVLRLIIL